MNAQISSNLQIFQEEKESFRDVLHQGHYYLAISFEDIPNQERREQLEKSGIQLLNWKGDKTFIATIPSKINAEKLSQLGVRSLQRVSLQEKMSKKLFNENYPQWTVKEKGAIDVVLTFHEPVSRMGRSENEKSIQNILRKYNARIINAKLGRGLMIKTRIAQGLQFELATLPQLAYIEEEVKEEEPLNHETRSTLRANVLHRAPESFGIKGKGVTVGVGDGGELGDHIDFQGRVINKANGTYNSYGAHGDVTSGIIASGGNLNPRHKGMAPECEIITQKTSRIINNAGEYFDEHRMVLTNNSYGVTAYCREQNVYNYTSLDIDQRAHDYEKQLHVFAAGNGGGQNCGDYPKGFASILPFAQSAKNNLLVGSINDKREIAGNSSKGPTFDGRIKPELVGVGVGVISTGRNFNYQGGGGTSAASPSVTGTLALLYQKYRLHHNDEDPDGGLIKAIACNTADDLGNKGPDFTYGFGVINARRAYNAIENEQFFSNEIGHQVSNQHEVEIPAGVSQVKIMLYWPDAPAESGVAKALVNDLDLSLVAPDNQTWQPWVLNQVPALANELATRGQDTINNIEQITIDNPQAGSYQINVNGFEIPEGTQKYYLTYEFLYPELELIYPYGEEHMEANTKEWIQWDTEFNNTSTFKLEYSTDNGNTWMVIAENIAADQRFFLWNVPDLQSSKTFVRIFKEANELYDINRAFSIMPLPTIDSISALCEGYAKANWSSMGEAASYQVTTLGEKGMQIIEETQDTFLIVSNPSQVGEKYWYGLEIEQVDGVVTERSLAMDYESNSTSVCPWANDLKLAKVGATRLKGRTNTSRALDQERISMQMKNIGNNMLTDITAKLRVNGQVVNTEQIESSINSGDTLDFAFAKSIDVSKEGHYIIDAWVTSPWDSRNQNDSLIVAMEMVQLENAPVTLPFLEDFTTIEEFPCERENIGIKGIAKWDFISRTGGCFVDGWKSAGMAIDWEAEELDSLSDDELILTLNLNHLDVRDGLDLSLSQFNYLDSTQTKLWVRGEDTREWLEVQELRQTEGWDWDTLSVIDLSTIMIEANHILTESFQIRFTRQGNNEYYLNHLFLTQRDSTPLTRVQDFRATRRDDIVLLEWETLSEKYNDYFEIEIARSPFEKEAGMFSWLGRVDGNGTSATGLDYQYVDREAFKFGIRYYRLKQVAMDGSFTYSPIVSVDFPALEKSIRVYPNPFSESLKIEMIHDEKTRIYFRIFDRLGQLVAKTNKEIEIGFNAIELDALFNDLPKGLYFLEIEEKGIPSFYKLNKC